MANPVGIRVTYNDYVQSQIARADGKIQALGDGPSEESAQKVHAQVEKILTRLNAHIEGRADKQTKYQPALEQLASLTTKIQSVVERAKSAESIFGENRAVFATPAATPAPVQETLDRTEDASEVAKVLFTADTDATTQDVETAPVEQVQAAPAQPQTTKVSVSYNAGYGNSLALRTSRDWNANVDLTWTEGNVWEVDLPSDEKVEFKVVLVLGDAKEIQWEVRSENRTVEAGQPLTIIDISF